MTVDDFEIVTKPFVRPEALPSNGVLVELLFLSADPFQRSRFKQQESAGAVVSGYAAGRIVESNNGNWPVGALFGAYCPFTTPATFNKLQVAAFFNVTPYCGEGNGVEKPLPLSLAVGVLGMPGATAYGGLLKVLAAKKDEILFVSAASGAVGALVGQIAAKEVGCTVIGSCGGPEKVEHCLKLGFTHAIDYKTCSSAADLQARIKQIAPNGIDMTFEV